MTLPDREEAKSILWEYVQDEYQRHHALMVAAATGSYAEKFNGDRHLWWLTGYFHDIDYDQYPTEHPGPSLKWFEEWGYPSELIHAVEAHADGFNGFTTKPETDLARTLLACDEISGIFYAYKKLNPIPYSDMKTSSIKKRLKEEKFAPGISRDHIYPAVEAIGVIIDEHIDMLKIAFSSLDS